MSATKLTNEQIKWLITIGWKKKTVNQLAEELKVERFLVAYIFKKHKIEPISNVDILATRLIDLCNDGHPYNVMMLAEKLDTTTFLISEAIDEYGLFHGQTLKKGAKLKPKAPVLTLEEKIAAKKASKPPAVYSQSGSDLLDELRGIKTTNRESTLLTSIIKEQKNKDD